MQRLCQQISVFLLALALGGAAQAASITGVTIAPMDTGAEQIVFRTDKAITPLKAFTLENPNRVVVDIPSAHASGVTLPKNYAGTLVGNVRFGQFDFNTSRLVIDLRAPVRITHAAADGSNRLVIEIAPTVPSPIGGGLGWGHKEPGVTPHVPYVPLPASPLQGEESRPSPFAAMESDAPVKVVTPPTNNPSPTVAAAPAAKLPLIVIDAGHGGQDPGALGKHDTREKNVTLAMAKAVKVGLLRTGRYRVLLTRENDTYIPLQGRVDIARRAKADVFISLHADSNPKTEARGLSVYTLSENASDDESKALADRENKSDIIAGLDLDTADADVASILIDLTQRETMNKSAQFADKVVSSLNPRIQQLPSTHRFAGFRVLKAPDIPSVLIEMGFISNNSDEELLTSADYRELFVASLVKALDRYIKNNPPNN